MRGVLRRTEVIDNVTEYEVAKVVKTLKYTKCEKNAELGEISIECRKEGGETMVK